MKIEVNSAEVVLDSLYYLVDTPDTKVIYVDSVSKRFQIWGGTNHMPDGSVEEKLLLTSVEGGRGYDDSSDETTLITITVPPEDGKRWHFQYPSGGRYNFEIVAYRIDEILTENDSSLIWENEKVYDQPEV